MGSGSEKSSLSGSLHIFLAKITFCFVTDKRKVEKKLEKKKENAQLITVIRLNGAKLFALNHK